MKDKIGTTPQQCRSGGKKNVKDGATKNSKGGINNVVSEKKGTSSSKNRK